MTRNEEILKRLKEFINTYDKQRFFNLYQEETIIKDMIYGIGVAINEEKYKFANGYDDFLQYLKDNILFSGN